MVYQDPFSFNDSHNKFKNRTNTFDISVIKCLYNCPEKFVVTSIEAFLGLLGSMMVAYWGGGSFCQDHYSHNAPKNCMKLYWSTNESFKKLSTFVSSLKIHRFVDGCQPGWAKWTKPCFPYTPSNIIKSLRSICFPSWGMFGGRRVMCT